MKTQKLILSLICIATIFSFTACSTSNKTVSNNDSSTISTSTETQASDNHVQIPNPWVDCSSLEDAARFAGFSLQAPEQIDNYPDILIQSIEKEIIQVIYQNDTSSITIRKGVGLDDISGDYNEYNESSTETINEHQVTEKGNDGKVYLAIWSDGDYSYAVSTPGMTSDEVTAIITQIK